MRIIDAIENKTGNPYYIPNCSRDDLPELFKELGFKVGAEIGVSTGENLEKYCKMGFKMYGIDPWTNEYDGIYDDPHKIRDHVYDVAVERLSPYSNCTLIRKLSLDALKDITKDSLDFVYIDGNHMYGYVAMDLMAWGDKIRKGGIIAGHDYYHTKINDSKFIHTKHVRSGVKGYVEAFDINNWYILGRKSSKKGEIQDKELSFMFIKHW